MKILLKKRVKSQTKDNVIERVVFPLAKEWQCSTIWECAQLSDNLQPNKINVKLKKKIKKLQIKCEINRENTFAWLDLLTAFIVFIEVIRFSVKCTGICLHWTCTNSHSIVWAKASGPLKSLITMEHRHTVPLNHCV